MTTTTLIQRIKDLTARFGKGWHDGIQIDASDIADLCLAADALEQQAAQIEALRADATRYRWLRMRDWFNSELCVLRDPKRVLTEGIGLGADCPSLSRLDAAIDAALRQEQPTKGEGA